MSEADADPEAKAKPQSATRRKVAVVGMLVAGMIVPLLGIVVAWKSCGHSAVAGAVEVKDSPLGAWRTTIASCTSGGEQGYRGVMLAGANGKPAVRVEIDPIDGALVSLWSADGKGPIVLRKKDCATLAADVREAGKHDDDTPAHYHGNVSGACALPGGGTLSLDAWWRDCGE